MSKALVNYEESIKSVDTRKTYGKYLKQFLDYAKIDPDKFVNMTSSEIEDIVIHYIIKLKRRVEAKDFSPNSFNVAIAPIQLLLEQNDVILNWKKIKRMFPRRIKPQSELPYTTKDIQLMLASTLSPRNKAFIHFLASTGCRLGAIKELQVKHLQEVEDCCAVTFYEDDLEQYLGFLTPEAYQSLKEYFDYRREHGEVITKQSPLFSGTGHHAGQHVSAKALQLITNSVLKKSRIRLTSSKKSRHDKAQNHAFRKRFNTILKMNNEINSNVAEKLMGHRNGLDGVYLKPTLDQCFKEFKKAIPEITISDETRQFMKIKQQEEKISSLETGQKKMLQLEEGVNIIGALLSEQMVKGNIFKELENPTHHHTKQQILSLKEFIKSPPSHDVWTAFMEWSKKGSKI